MSKEATIAKRVNVSSRTMAFGEGRGERKVRDAIMNRAGSLAARYPNSFERINRSQTNMRIKLAGL